MAVPHSDVQRVTEGHHEGGNNQDKGRDYQDIGELVHACTIGQESKSFTFDRPLRSRNATPRHRRTGDQGRLTRVLPEVIAAI